MSLVSGMMYVSVQLFWKISTMIAGIIWAHNTPLQRKYKGIVKIVNFMDMINQNLTAYVLIYFIVWK